MGRDISFIRKLVDLLSTEDLALSDEMGQTALHKAAAVHDICLAKLLIDRNQDLPNIGDKEDHLPIRVAASSAGQREMAFYLHNLTTMDSELILDLIECAVGAGMFDFALHLLEQYPELPWSKPSTLEKLAVQDFHFPSGTTLNILQRLIYKFIPVKYSTELLHNLVEKERIKSFEDCEVESGKATSQSSSRVNERNVFREILEKLVQPIEDIRVLKLKHCVVLEVVRRLCMEIKRFDATGFCAIGALRRATQYGIHEIVEQGLAEFPLIITRKDEWQHLLLDYAALYRQEKIFHMIYHKSGPSKQTLLETFDANGNSVLHLVAHKPLNNRLDNLFGVLQLQRELQWYKGVENLTTPQMRAVTNHYNQTPLMLFEEHHRDMVAKEGEWIVGMANTCIVAASLIATVVFAAAITVPGGNNNNGHPNFSSSIAFKVFAFSDSLALISSITTVLVFLSIFTARYSIYDYTSALSERLTIGLISLFFSVTFMMVAFGAVVYLVVPEDDWIVTPSTILACVPVIFFGYLQVPSLLKLIKSTYAPSMFSKP